MGRLALAAMATATMCLLAACASPLLSPDDRKQTCAFAVDRKFASPTFHANPLSSAAGGMVGAGVGAGQGVFAGGGSLAAIVTVPLGALIGAGYGTTCAAASLSHPTADADFERLLQAADYGVLTRALEADLNAGRAECSYTATDAFPKPAPDAVVAIEKIDAGMGCLYGQQDYWIAVEWRTTRVKTWTEINWTTTKCDQVSFRTVDDWFGSPDQARAEIERVLARTGQRMAMELLGQHTLTECKLRSREDGEIVDR